MPTTTAPHSSNPGFMSRAPTASLVALAPLATLPGSPQQRQRGPCPVVALYSDAVVRVWDLDRHTVLLAAPLPQLPQLAGTRPVGLSVGQVIAGGSGTVRAVVW